MSHISSIQLKVWNPQCLDTAAFVKGLERRDQRTFKTYGGSGNRCEWAYGVPNNKNAYEIGVVQMPDGSYELRTDFWGGGHGTEELVGKEGVELVREYEKQVYYSEMVSQGYEISETVLSDGTRRVSAVRYAQ